jgi:hypothetical protein
MPVKLYESPPEVNSVVDDQLMRLAMRIYMTVDSKRGSLLTSSR